MKEIAELKEVQPPAKLTYRGLLSKNHIRAKKCRSSVIEMRTEAAELIYHRMLNVIKELYTADGNGAIVFERDYKKDRESLDSMHCFITPDVYFGLRCDHDMLCWIDYSFDGWKHKGIVMDVLSKGATMSYLKKKEFKDGFDTFYRKVLAYQESVYQFVI